MWFYDDPDLQISGFQVLQECKFAEIRKLALAPILGGQEKRQEKTDDRTAILKIF